VVKPCDNERLTVVLLVLSLPYLHALIDSLLKISESNAFFDRLATERGVECPPPRTTARLLDKVCSTYLYTYRQQQWLKLSSHTHTHTYVCMYGCICVRVRKV